MILHILCCCVGSSEPVWHDIKQRGRQVEDVNMPFSRNVYLHTPELVKTPSVCQVITSLCVCFFFLTRDLLEIPVIWEVLISQAWVDCPCFHVFCVKLPEQYWCLLLIWNLLWTSQPVKHVSSFSSLKSVCWWWYSTCGSIYCDSLFQHIPKVLNWVEVWCLCRSFEFNITGPNIHAMKVFFVVVVVASFSLEQISFPCSALLFFFLIAHAFVTISGSMAVLV